MKTNKNSKHIYLNCINFSAKKHLIKQKHVFLAYVGLLLVDVTQQLLESFLSRILMVYWSVGYF